MSLQQSNTAPTPTPRPGRVPATVDPKPWMALVGVALLALGMLLGALGHNLDPSTTGELGVLQWFHEHRNGFLTVVAKVLELVMGPKVVPWLLVAMPLLFLALRRIIMAVTSLLLPALGWLPGHLAKGFFPRARPPHSLDPVVIYNDHASFPSGHTGFTTSITIFILFALTMWGVRRWWTVVLGVLFIVTVGLSRLYAAAHFPLDVLGGAVLASGTSVALWPLAAWWWGRGQAGGGRLAEPPYRRALTGRSADASSPEREIGVDTTG